MRFRIYCDQLNDYVNGGRSIATLKEAEKLRDELANLMQVRKSDLEIRVTKDLPCAM